MPFAGYWIKNKEIHIRPVSYSRCSPRRARPSFPNYYLDILPTLIYFFLWIMNGYSVACWVLCESIFIYNVLFCRGGP